VVSRVSLLLGLSVCLLATCSVAGAEAAGVGSAIALTKAHPAPRERATAAGECPTGTPLDAPAPAQEQAMLCLTNQARSKYGEPPLEEVEALRSSASDKANDIVACDSFSHNACGREFTYWMRQVGYLSSACWRVGENLAWGSAGYGTVDSIFRAWMNSSEHRSNILGNYDQIGIDLTVGPLNGLGGTHVWAQHFGSHCEGS
jgi:uncharacterized protein YkwD